MMLGIIPNRELAEKAVNRLEDSGFNPKDISIIMRDTREARELGESTGVLVGTLAGLGIPEEEARVYEDSIKAGAILIAVPVLNEEEEKVRDILERYGATQIRSLEHEETLREYRRPYEDDGYYVMGAKGGEAGDFDEDWEEPKPRSKVRRRVG